MAGFNLNRLVRSNIQTLKPYSSARDEFKEVSTDMVFIDANENPFENGVNRYPDPKQNKVKAQLSKLKGVPSNQILLGNGSDEVLDLIFRAFCEPNRDVVITLPPTYGMYEVLANVNAIDVIKIPLDNSFEPKVNDILDEANERTKLLFLCSPNNPTSNSFKAEKIELLLNQFSGIVVIDEAYIDFSHDESWINRLGEFPNLIVTQTLSKAYGMAGIRLGVSYASEEIISILDRIKPPYNVNELTQLKALERLSQQDTVNKEIENILNERTKLASALNDISIIENVYPSDANFILARVDDANRRYQELILKGIVVRNRTNQPLCENCLRFTVGNAEENNLLIKALKEL
ncbi:histidinol-phosphate transaminase [Psychroserpens sp.]|uniref:histidinol-phosphate transaminase n=1 Tax=Psychroserpens sp. TaxID=2020870 RepID=UPI001B1E78D3|nr:histidinol-phosphate transaminase [Psychroserpens sp.]MBO6606451.1 histidinol-phosphate transaminase [Psychroserpens sp.]MBO6631393.1 histidinol-phosphate transaminase [Psychroserpens sp.]MBO6653155.1 histidinol-phosphate transaminase [Psychroserpens sp.]MBO6680817.1 histidinol-phosphate transaminase [Psychroserpens sp.]MBO6750225.1 histidinol-phosphate transaminase [Psychroserpens sp.]